MLRNYFTIALRQLRKQGMYAAITIGGFALSIAACLLITLYIRHEVSYDKDIPDGSRIYRVVNAYVMPTYSGADVYMWAPLAKTAKSLFPEIESAGRYMNSALFYGAGSNEVKRADQAQNTYEEGFVYFDQSLLDILQVPMVYGSRAQALAQPNSIVISQSKAGKYFPGKDPVGQVLILNNDVEHPYRIGGVMKDFPSTSHFHGFDFLLTMTGHELWNGEQDAWYATNYPTYIKVRPGTDPKVLARKMQLIADNYIGPQMVKDGDAVDAKNIDKEFHFELQPIGDVYLHSKGIQGNFAHTDFNLVWLFGAIAAFILLIAVINFVNLATAKSANRAKEVGLRKVVGSYRSHLIRQFLVESLLYSLVSFALGILIAWGMMPLFDLLSGKDLSIPWAAWWWMPSIVAASLLVGLLAGIYPAFYLSDFKPIQVLKGNLSRGSRNARLRSVLVVFQFSTSVVLIIGTIVIFRQMHFIMSKQVGFDKDQVMVLEGTGTLSVSQIRTFRQELLKIPQVQDATISDYLPIEGTKRNGNTYWNEGRQKMDPGVGMQHWVVDYDYIPTLGMQIVKGRNFSRDMPSDTNGAMIINQTFADKLGLKDPIGKRIGNGGNFLWTIIGVVRNFNFESLRDTVDAVGMELGISSNNVSVKLKGADAGNAVPRIVALWKQFAPDQPLRYTFMDQSFASMYRDVTQAGRIFTSFSILAIIIACLGLFALSAFMAEQRSKEMSIRKVLGASAAQVTALLSKGFLGLVVVSFAIGMPLAALGMTMWLRDFAAENRIGLSWWFFGVAGLAVLTIALGTVSVQAIRTALANPVKGLRSE